MAANMIGIGELLGQGAASVRTAGAAAGEGETAFAQLLEGLGVVPPTTNMDAVAPVKPAQSEAENLAEATTTTPAEMLAMCGVPMPIPMAPQESTSVPPLIAARQALDTASVTIEQPATGAAKTAEMLQPPTAAAPQPGAASHRDSTTGTLTAADVQWLHSTSAAMSKQVAQPAAPRVSSLPASPQQAETQKVTLQQTPVPQAQSLPTQAQQIQPEQIQAQQAQVQQTQAQQTQMQPAAAMANDRPSHATRDVLPIVPQNELDTPAEQQVQLQAVVTQAAPTLAAMNTQWVTSLKEERPAVSSVDAAGISSALTSAQMQTPGTQLASDANAIDPTPRHQLHAQVGTHQWATELGNKLTLMATKDTQSATLYMTPADLGPVQVRIDMNQDQASVWFTAEHAETRSALEQSLPRLREMFASQGMSLTDAGVFGDRSRQQQPESEPSANRFVGSQYLSDDELADTATVRSLSLGLLDAYA